MPVLIKGSGKIPKLQPKEVPSYKEKITYTPDDGYDGFSEVTVNAIPKAVQAIPEITVNQDGIITASVYQTEGYVLSGTKSAEHPLSTQSGKTVTPSTTQQTAVASRKYTTGNVYVAGDSNLVADNIKKGVSIFGVTGTYAGKAKVYVAHNITPVKLTPSSSDTWTSCAQITMKASAIKKLLDTSNSAETLSSDLYGKTPNAVVATISSIWNLPTHPQFVSHFECYGNGYDLYTYYNGASNGYEYISLSSTDKSRTFKCLADNTNGTVIGQLFLSSNYNMSTSDSYDVYLIY